MSASVVIIGLGEIGGVLARAYLKSGTTVIPAVRETDLAQLATSSPAPKSVIVAVGEADLQQTLQTIPDVWRDRLVLIQNELLPRDWEAHQLVNPTIMSVWFEKKPGQDVKVVVPSVAYGPAASRLCEALDKVNIPLTCLDSENTLLFELVRKNLYILTTNIAGLQTGGNVLELWQQHRELAESVANDVLNLQFQLCSKDLDKSALIAAMVTAFEGDPEHGCMGRSAPARLARALDLAEQFKLDVPTLNAIGTNRV